MRIIKKNEMLQIFIYLRNYQIDMENFQNFIYMKSRIFLEKHIFRGFCPHI